VGDNLRRTLPFTALGGAMLVLACDILGRVAIAPYEIPVGTVLGVVGSVAFLALLLRRRARVS
jgi:iron complex transport system permease protein